MKVTIVGAGIGGLTLANALQKKGVDFEIYEAFSEFKTVGAGIILAENAMKVFRELELSPRLREVGNSLNSVRITDPKLGILLSNSTSVESETVALHRADLQYQLLYNLPKEKIHLGKRIDKLDTTNGNTMLMFDDGTSHSASIVIGCDGINSKVRDAVIANSEIRYANQSCWRGVLNYQLPREFTENVHEIWGEGLRIGIVQLNEEQGYWYALKDSEKSDQQLNPAKLAQLFKNYPALVIDILKATGDDQIILNDMIDLDPIDKWYRDSVCLLGDAAHATTPNLGQGACQSIVDAKVLADCLSVYDAAPKAFKEYQKQRFKAANKITKMSWTLGKIAHWKSPIAVNFRNSMLRISAKLVGNL